MSAMRLTDRMDRLGTETAFAANARARTLEATGRDVIHLEVGEPDFDTPPNVRAAAERAIEEGFTHYGPAMGLPVLREAIAADATARKGFPVDPSQVVVTPGGKPVMSYAITALIGEGDEAIIPDPGFPIYASMTTFVGGVPISLPIRQADGFGFDLDRLESLISPRTRLIILNSPANPTGGVLTRAELERIAELAIAHDLAILTDEIYGRIVYEGEHISIASLPGMAERTVVLDGFSKAYAMTGWRLGYGIVPPSAVDAFERLVINSFSCVSTFSQIAAVEALTGPQDAVDAMVREFRARRDLIVDGLAAIPGISCLRPSGAFYVFPDVTGTGMSGAAFAERALNQAGVSVLGGTAFGAEGRDHVRMSYANSQPRIAEALERLLAIVGAVHA
ncbi:MAG: aspartate aminotransferase [Chloroflexota bacterium]|nr:aspartate aminotransferase [Chloroflexota bacterium]